MAYCTVDDLIHRIPESALINLSNDVGGALVIHAANVAEAIATADAEIDSFVGLVHSVPMDPAPPLLTDLSAKMAIWNLHLRKYFKSEIWQDTYKTCQRILLRIAEGKLKLNHTTDVEDDTTDLVIASTRVQKFTQAMWDTF
jgi:phage gp36-like protein